MKAVRELKRFLPSVYNTGDLTEQDVHFVLGKVREILENKGEYKTLFPELNLFCNWCFHSKLSGSKTIFKALVNISKSISAASKQGMEHREKVETTEKFISTSANILNIPKLRVGLKTVLENYGIDAKIASNKQWWTGFIRLLLHEVSEKPLKFPDKVVSGEIAKGREYNAFQELIKMQGSDKGKIISLEIQIDKKANEIKIHLKSINDVIYVLGVQGEEPDEVFNS